MPVLKGCDVRDVRDALTISCPALTIPPPIRPRHQSSSFTAHLGSADSLGPTDRAMLGSGSHLHGPAPQKTREVLRCELQEGEALDDRSNCPTLLSTRLRANMEHISESRSDSRRSPLKLQRSRDIGGCSQTFTNAKRAPSDEAVQNQRLQRVLDILNLQMPGKFSFRLLQHTHAHSCAELARSLLCDVVNVLM